MSVRARVDSQSIVGSDLISYQKCDERVPCCELWRAFGGFSKLLNGKRLGLASLGLASVDGKPFLAVTASVRRGA